MKESVKKKSANVTRDRYANLTKSTLVTKSKIAGRRAARNAMKTMGFVITTQGNWVVKKYANGDLEKISKLSDK